MFHQDPLSRSRLICKLTGLTVNKIEEHIWKQNCILLMNIQIKNFNAKLGDLGLARSCFEEETRIMGIPSDTGLLVIRQQKGLYR